MPRSYTVAELQVVARDAGIKISRDTLYDWLKAGTLVGYKLNGSTSPWLIDERDWIAFVDGRRQAALAAAEKAVAS